MSGGLGFNFTQAMGFVDRNTVVPSHPGTAINLCGIKNLEIGTRGATIYIFRY